MCKQRVNMDDLPTVRTRTLITQVESLRINFYVLSLVLCRIVTSFPVIGINNERKD